MILLMSDGRPSKDVCKIVEMSNISVNGWLNRHKLEGISGLAIKLGRGCKPKIDREKDEEKILASAKRHRQRLVTAKAEWNFNSGKSVSRDIFRRFLKVLVDDTSELDEFTVLQNVMLLGLKLGKYSEEEVERRAIEKLKMFSIDTLARKQASQISGGEKQRVVITKTLINDPHIIMGHELTGNLDHKNSKIVFNVLIN